MITAAQPGEFPTAWSSDGRSLFLITRGQIPAQVFRVDVSSGQKTFWRSFEPADAAGIDTIRGVLGFQRQQSLRVRVYADTLGFVSRAVG